MFNYIPNEGIKEYLQIYPNIKPREDTENPFIFLKFFKKPKSIKDINNNKNSVIEIIKNKSLLNIDKNIQKKSMGKRGSFLNNRGNAKILQSSFDEEKFKKEYNDILDIPGIEKYTKNKITKRKIGKDKDINEEEDFFENDFYYLIKKGIFLQNNNNKRTPDVKASLQLFLFNSNYIEKLKNKLNFIDDIQYRIKNKIMKLSEKVFIKHYPTSSIISKINENGDECYFLISGKIGIIRPMEYKDIQMTYHDYFIYLKILLDLDEIDLVLKAIFANQNLLEIDTVYEINRLVRAYFLVSFQRILSKKDNGVTMNEIELFFNTHHFSFEDFQLSKKIIIEDIKKMNKGILNIHMILLIYY